MKTLACVLLASALLVGCGGEAAPPAGSAAKPAAPPPKVDRKAPAGKEAAPEADDKGEVPPPVDIQEAEFVESDRSRDPFRSFAAYFIAEARGQVKSQREVVLDQYAVDELKLVGIVTRVEPAKAMLVDPTGVGHVVQRGMFIGRATVVQPTSGVGAAYEVNWRIDRIREGDMVLVRDDPANPDVPSATRVIPLRTEDTTVSETTGEAGKPTEAALENQIDELKRRLETVEERKTTVEVVPPKPAPPAGQAPTSPGVVKAPGGK